MPGRTIKSSSLNLQSLMMHQGSALPPDRLMMLGRLFSRKMLVCKFLHQMYNLQTRLQFGHGHQSDVLSCGLDNSHPQYACNHTVPARADGGQQGGLRNNIASQVHSP
mmetsp:Transcript_6074/g.12806  ORF Transcript_6074/g.12806 Transcript_6074/m.12806 type:complete len:108 (+) Transcript_6074:290-613(+)